ncbi:hypothetical protein M430DRAFT_200720 [Amorphotheca resinae ATCC 22711]|uniref:Uncharacterized protein n=1 Tax=Amorphotheca resinae ATCC 22711 TaxID=857342 RepID=A0A2T3BAL9_AMORE|nr:hypothetical protein M430DRAFT_200720 [Amorphotheca resinae ATCC 22711]PSS25314.1 hypothetical protein M430DRAFT_200720 [Amorphotheca resinae ATCC 22711]
MTDPSPIATSNLAPGESPGGTTIIVDVPPTIRTAMSLRSPIKYNPKLPSSTSFTAPPLEWLQGTWSVTHSTLPMWRKAKNVRITYKIIPSTNPSSPTLLDDEVRSEPIQWSLLPQPKSIRGIDTPDGEGSWNWRGKGWLKIASSHWELLGWGERGDEKWAVTWFAPSLFTPAGLDIYSSRKEGMSEVLYKDILQALERLEAKEVADLAKAEMKEVKIDY